MKICKIALVPFLLTACGLSAVQRDAGSTYDFGLLSATNLQNVKFPVPPVPVLVSRVEAAPWLDGSAILYRLAFVDDARPQPYRDSRWIAPPASLLTERLRARIAGADQGTVRYFPETGWTGYVARLQLEEFSQVFDSAATSHVVVRIRASVLDYGPDSLIAQRTFNIERRTATPDAEGAVRAFTAASDSLIDSFLDWLAASLHNVPAKRVEGSRAHLQ
jgi:cholesterol transport system auxiliary component